MVVASRLDGGNQITSMRVRKIIQSIKEIVGNHSDADIYAVLKESNMDPNETAQKLLNQDPFHEVKRKREKKKELTGNGDSSDAKRHVEHSVQSAKSHTTWNQNVRRGSYSRNAVPDAGVNREFRVVRDNRVKQNGDAKLESVQISASGKEHVKSNDPDKSLAGVSADQKHSAVSNSDGAMLSQGVNRQGEFELDHSTDAGPSCGDTSSRPEETKSAASNSQPRRAVQDNSQAGSASTSTSSVVGLYSSSSDPVHVPSASRSAGAVGAIRREVGVVGVRRQSSNNTTVTSSVSNSSPSLSSPGKDVSSAESFAPVLTKCNQPNQAAVSEPVMPSIPVSRSFPGSQYNSKMHQQPVGHQKAMQLNMEWKPKSNQKPTVTSPSESGTASVPASSCTKNASGSNPANSSNVSEKLSQVNILEDQHVIIPQHLRVPESERTQLTFGSFGAGFDSTKGYTSAFQALQNSEQSGDEPSVSLSASAPVGPIENASPTGQEDLTDCQARMSRSDSPTSAAQSDQPQSSNNESLSPQNIESYADIGLVQSHSPPYSSPQAQQLQTPPSLPSFSAYDSQTSYDVPFFRTVVEDNVRGLGIASPSETVSAHATGSTAPLLQQQQPVQQQPAPQLYPQVHISHFPNFVPYRHIFSPVYGPPMAVPNYSSNQAYPHPSNGSSYLLMPGGSSHITAGGMKYASSQYKPLPAGSPTGYGNYSNPGGFAMSTPGSVGGATGLEDVNRLKYKDNNLYVPNPQAEASDMWIQTPRELPGLQSAQYYNMSAQPPHAAAAAFMPAAHSGHPSFNAAAAQSSHMQYPGVYHPSPSPASIAGPHHLVHQPGLGGNIGGVGVAAAAASPGPQVGAYQQPQLSHLNWPANF